ncbi:33197_t:CDS:1 [Gigaspora margarita]|uniref:33197_t:CDS:1 n=1 Tax=Gigaspora margarita TaxID=4874 RepID=A0ABM8W576_GIGMA|nr:33197_t:CDS:1 [Gigaspora margarita]
MSYSYNGKPMVYTPIQPQNFRQQPTLVYNTQITQFNLQPPVPRNPKRRQPKKDNRCYECRKLGHYRKNCPRLRNQSRQNVVVNVMVPKKTNIFSRFLKW